MGMDAEVIAIGPYRSYLSDCMDYPAYDYKNVPDGSMVITSVFVCETSSASVELADAFGVDPWDFSQHHLDPIRFSAEYITSAQEEGSAIRGSVDKFVRLRAAGYDFYFRSNG